MMAEYIKKQIWNNVLNWMKRFYNLMKRVLDRVPYAYRIMIISIGTIILALVLYKILSGLIKIVFWITIIGVILGSVLKLVEYFSNNREEKTQ